MKIIGITGPTGAGKGLLCKALEKRNIPCIDADAVYHSLLISPSACLDALRKSFGNGVFTEDGALDRNALGAVVFNDAEKLQLLNDTVLSFVLDEIRTMIADLEGKGFQTVAVDAPTLIESGFNEECDAVISVLAPPPLRLERIINRDGISKEKAETRIKAQKADCFYEKNSDYVITNDASPKEFEEKIEKLLSSLEPALQRNAE